MFYVNVYQIGRAYGGKEEGGWWYDYGLPVDLYCEEKPYPTKEEAKAKAEQIYEQLAVLNEEHADINSVEGDGLFQVFVEEEPAKAWPAVIPSWES